MVYRDWEMIEAVHNGDLHYIERRYDYGDTDFDDALFEAYISRRMEIIHFLIEKGLTTTEGRDRALIWAATYGDNEIVEIMLEHGVSKDAREEAIYRATRNGRDLRSLFDTFY